MSKRETSSWAAAVFACAWTTHPAHGWRYIVLIGMKQVISTQQAPQAIGPYSQAIVSNGFVFLSGQIPLDPATGLLVEGDIAAQTERVLENIKAVLAAAGSSLDNVVKTTVFLKNMGDFPRMNEVYARYFPAPSPARSTVEAARLPRDVQVEIDCIATLA